MQITQRFFKLTSYLVRYQWGFIQGKVKYVEPYKGVLTRDYVDIPLDDITDMAIAVSNAYSMSLSEVLDMYYPDMTVLYAKHVNSEAYKSYINYISLGDEARGKYVMDYGEPQPYVFTLLTPEIQRARLEEKEDTNGLRALYRSRGR